mmetsp:Transcript_64824/g.145681  ORF Transcript_64824/g.145681 Transcript_64824/m.145681 type:complete len:95 (-) Transcript_64824:1630-1914(-)
MLQRDTSMLDHRNPKSTACRLKDVIAPVRKKPLCQKPPNGGLYQWQDLPRGEVTEGREDLHCRHTKGPKRFAHFVSVQTNLTPWSPLLFMRPPQ